MNAYVLANICTMQCQCTVKSISATREVEPLMYLT